MESNTPSTVYTPGLISKAEIVDFYTFVEESFPPEPVRFDCNI